MHDITDVQLANFIDDYWNIREFGQRLEAIRKEAQAELARIERDGGEARFAMRILAIVEGNDD